MGAVAIQRFRSLLARYGEAMESGLLCEELGAQELDGPGKRRFAAKRLAWISKSTKLRELVVTRYKEALNPYEGVAARRAFTAALKAGLTAEEMAELLPKKLRNELGELIYVMQQEGK